MHRAQKCVRLLKSKGLTVAAAESCTGGYASYLLTSIPGSSKVFKGSLVVYSLQAKRSLLGLKQRLLDKTQGVSKDTARRLADSVRKKLRADIGAAVVGFAGPSSFKGIKPGTVFLCAADKRGMTCKKVIVKGNRSAVRKKASFLLIEMIEKRAREL